MKKFSISKIKLKSLLRSSSTLEEAALKLGVDRRTLYNLRKEKGLKIAVRG